MGTTQTAMATSKYHSRVFNMLNRPWAGLSLPLAASEYAHTAVTLNDVMHSTTMSCTPLLRRMQYVEPRARAYALDTRSRVPSPRRGSSGKHRLCICDSTKRRNEKRAILVRSFFFFFSRTLLLSSFWTSRGHRCRPFFPPVLAFNFHRA